MTSSVLLKSFNRCYFLDSEQNNLLVLQENYVEKALLHQFLLAPTLEVWNSSLRPQIMPRDFISLIKLLNQTTFLVKPFTFTIYHPAFCRSWVLIGIRWEAGSSLPWSSWLHSTDENKASEMWGTGTPSMILFIVYPSELKGPNEFWKISAQTSSFCWLCLKVQFM